MIVTRAMKDDFTGQGNRERRGCYFKKESLSEAGPSEWRPEFSEASSGDKRPVISKEEILLPTGGGAIVMKVTFEFPQDFNKEWPAAVGTVIRQGQACL